MDLEGSGSAFAADISSWSYAGVLSTPINTQCAGIDLLGGYNVLDTAGSFTRTYTGLPAHNAIYFTWSFYIIDGWDDTDTIFVKFDNKIINFKGAQNSGSTNLCGGFVADSG